MGGATELRYLVPVGLRSRIEPIKRVARTLQMRWDQIENYFRDRITNAGAEAIGTKIRRRGGVHVASAAVSASVRRFTSTAASSISTRGASPAGREFSHTKAGRTKLLLRRSDHGDVPYPLATRRCRASSLSRWPLRPGTEVDSWTVLPAGGVSRAQRLRRPKSCRRCRQQHERPTRQQLSESDPLSISSEAV